MLISAWLVLWAAVDPSEMPGWFRCPLLHLTGYFCPGCGSTRATHLLLNGRSFDALRHNPLAVVLGILAVVLLVVSSILTFRGRADRMPQGSWIAWVLLAGIVLFWIARNVPLDVFDAIRPPVAERPAE